MKTLIGSLVTWFCLTALSFGVSAWGPPPDDVYSIFKIADYSQNSAIIPGTANSWVFESFAAAVTANGTISAMFGTKPDGTTTFTHTLFDQEWEYENPPSTPFSSLTDLNTNWPDGNYQMSITRAGTEVINPFPLIGGFFVNIPGVTALTNASWVDGVIEIPYGNVVTVTINGSSTDFSDDIFTTGQDFIFVGFENWNTNDWTDLFLQDFATALTIGPTGSGADMEYTTSGTYSLELEYADVVFADPADGDPNGDETITGMLGLAAYSNVTSIDIQVTAIPEPATVAGLLGLGVFAFTLILRNRN